MALGNRPLVMSDGGLASLIGAWCAAEAASLADHGERAALWPAIWDRVEDDEAKRRRHAARAQAEAARLDIAAKPLNPPSEAALGERRSILLIAASGVARRFGCDRVLWPVQAAGTDDSDPSEDSARLAAIGDCVDRALLVTRLGELDEAGPSGADSPIVEAPYADLTDRQLAELALDLGVPVETCWWWDAPGESADAERRRWSAWFPASEPAGA